MNHDSGGDSDGGVDGGSDGGSDGGGERVRERSEIKLEGARPDMASADAREPTPMIVRGGANQEYWFEEGCFITEWLNSPEDPSLSIVRARVTPGVTTRLHRLVGVAERYVILEGIGRVEIVGPDGELKIADHYLSDVEPGDVVVIPPRVSQRISNIGETDLIFLALCTPRFTRAAYQDAES